MRRLLLIALLIAGMGHAADRYVDPSGGSDSNGGTNPTTDAWLTTQHAADTAVGGDTVYLCASATETPSARIDFDYVSHASSAASPITYIGADSGGTPLTTGFYTIAGSSLPATTDMIYLTISNIYLIFKRVRFTGGTRDGILINSPIFARFWNCRIDNFDSDGVYCTSTGGYLTFISCEIDSNTAYGTQINGAGRLNASLLGCDVHDNAVGARVGGDAGAARIEDTLIYGNTGDGLVCDGDTYLVNHCTIFNNGGDGFQSGAGSGSVINSTSTDNIGYGFNFATADYCSLDNSHTYSNTAGAISGTVLGDNNQTGDPLFTDTATQDFMPQTTSPLIRNGLNNSDIGAVAHADGGGGTTIIVVED
jgi:hypothetical protein